MAVLWCDDFNSYGTNIAYLSQGPYGEVGTISSSPALVNDPDPLVVGSKCFQAGKSAQSNITDNNCLRKVLPANKTTLGVALRLWMAALPAAEDMSVLPIVFKDPLNAILFSLWVTPTGAIYCVRNGRTYPGPTPLAQTSGPVLTANAWHHIECKAVFSATVGTIEVRVDGVAVINATNLDNIGTASPSGCASVAQVFDNDSSGAGVNWYIKDYVIWDSTGSHNNDFMGTVRVLRLPVDGDVSLNWTPSTGSTGWDLIDETPPVDSDYISAATPPPSPCVMSFANLPPDVTSVRALMTFVRASNSDGGDGKLQTSLVSNGVDANGADRQITVADTYWADVQEVDPDTTTSWTPASTDAANIKFNRTL